jgi:hypothetical protein
MATCKHPDRDVPKLVCGYPLPCPHHTVVIDCATVDEVIDRAALIAWLKRRPAVVIEMDVEAGPDGPRIALSRRAGFVRGDEVVPVPIQVTYLPITASIVEIRNAHEELTIEARAELEAKIKR